jgi:CDGSH-type Zn-finger protein
MADKRPKVLELEPGTYKWCACGKTGNDPWCDGTHRGSEFRPHTIEIKEKGRYALCCCRRSGGAPFCDGTHKTL